MHYLLQQLHKSKPELLDIPSELESVSKSSDSMCSLSLCCHVVLLHALCFSFHHWYICRVGRYVVIVWVLLSLVTLWISFTVMQKELDKIERFASKIVKQSNLPPTAADKLCKEAKVIPSFRGFIN